MHTEKSQEGDSARYYTPTTHRRLHLANNLADEIGRNKPDPKDSKGPSRDKNRSPAVAGNHVFLEGQMEMPSSSSCAGSTDEGASAIRSCAAVVLGKAITSRMDFSPASRATTRSSPKAMPPCGGVP